MKTLSIPNIYVVLWCIYFMQGVLFDENSRMSQILLLIIIAMSSLEYYNVFFKTNNSNSNYIKWTNRLFIFFSLYGMVYFLSGKSYMIVRSGTIVQSFGFLKQMIVSFLPLFTMYSYAKKGKVHEDDFRKWTVLFIITAIVFFYVERTNALRAAIEAHSLQVEFVNNSAYLFVAIIPILILWKGKLTIQYSLFFICLAFILFSMKRGAILCGAIAAICFGYYSYSINANRYKVRLFFLSLILFVAAYFIVTQLLSSSELFVDRINETLEGDSSSRDTIYSGLIKYIVSRDNIIHILLGEGANSTLLHSENYAHNDWLEIAVCEGLLGIFMYIKYWLVFFRTVNKKTIEKTSRFVLRSFLLVFFIRSFFSMSFNDLPIFASLAIGYYMGVVDRSSKAIYYTQVATIKN